MKRSTLMTRRTMHLLLLFSITTCHVQPSQSSTPGPSTCVDTVRWSNWINRNTPKSTSGDQEKMTSQEMRSFCGSGKLIAVECQTTGHVPSYRTGDSGVTCDLDYGLVCVVHGNGNGTCHDYMIRYMCQETKCDLCWAVKPKQPTTQPFLGPAKTPTHKTTFGPIGTTTAGSSLKPGATSTAMVTKSTVVILPLCVDQWSAWINTDSPTSDSGHRAGRAADQSLSFCPLGGKISAIECQTPAGAPVPCGDYRIRYECACDTSRTKDTLGPMHVVQLPRGTCYYDNGTPVACSPERLLIIGIILLSFA